MVKKLTIMLRFYLFFSYNFNDDKIISLQNISNLYLNWVLTALFSFFAIKIRMNVLVLTSVKLISGAISGMDVIDFVSYLKINFIRK